MLALSAPEGCTKFLEVPATHRVADFLIAADFIAFLDSLESIIDSSRKQELLIR
jgi:hypothetical protein